MLKMDDLSGRSAHLLKALSLVSRIALWLVLVAWLILICAWGSLHLFIVPRIGDFRPQLEARASQALGVKVQIGAISAHSEGLIPSFELLQVQLLDATGREALRLPRVVVALSPRSLWNLSFQQLYIERPELDIRRLKDGRIQVAGLDMSLSPDDHSASDWFFSQTEVAILGGSVQWTDELRELPTLALQQVDLVVRNRSRRHELRLDATPPAEWGERFSLMGRFRQPLLSLNKGRWREWDGEVHAAFARVDVAHLGRYAPLGLEVSSGNGALRAWVDVKHGKPTAATADVALSQVMLTPKPSLPPFSFTSLTGRLGGKRIPNGFEFSTDHLQFVTGEGVHWSGGNVRFSQTTGKDTATEQSELQADQLDLATLTQVASRLPLDPKTQATLLLYAPKGLVEKIQARWQGPLDQSSHYEAKGRVAQLEFEAAAPPATGKKSDVNQDAPPPLGRPGVRGVTLDFDLNQAGGRAKLVLKDGHLVFPGLFEEPLVPMAQLSTDVQWQIDGERLKVQLPNLKFNNADAQGEAQLKWQSAEPVASRENARFPGVLDLQGSLSRADPARVYRYLPQLIHRPVREYLHEAITQGKASGVKFRVKGDLRDMPFSDPKQGDFQISGRFSDTAFTYVPRSLQAAQALPWPGLSQMNGELLINRTSLQLKGVSGKITGTEALKIVRADVQIPDFLKAPVVRVNLEARGLANEFLERGVQGSPVAALTDHILDQAVVSGSAELQLKLGVPLTDLANTSVQGKLVLSNNDVQIFKNMPRLSAARGAVHFTEKGFAISGGQARFLGGEVRAEGGTIPLPGARTTGEPTLQAQGSLSAEGLRQATELGPLARILGSHASGTTAYSLVLDLRRGEPEFLITSSLQGLALNLPAPLGKTAEATLPVRLQSAVTLASPPTSAGKSKALQDQWSLNIGRLATVAYVRDVSGTQAQVLRGAIGVGLSPSETVPMPPAGVVANVNVDDLDIDTWTTLLTPATLAAPSNAAASSANLAGYLPTSLAVRAKTLTAAGRKINQVVVGSTREGAIWRANLDAKELNGYLEYRQSSAAGAGRLYARLARLSLAPSTAKDVETLLDEQPISIPALDIIVDDMELRGKRLGRVEIEAVNRGADSQDAVAREWRLNKFNISMPEASFTATGNWTVLNPAAPTLPGPRTTAATPEKRRTVMNFKLDLQDAGQLLERLGMQGVIRKGQGKMEGQVVWIGSPLALDYPTLGGAFNVNVENGQFLKADPGIAKLLGVLSLQALPRRLVLDFRDVFSDGFSFDSVRGDVQIEQGMAATHNLQMKGVNAAVLMEGRADIAKETQDIKVVVVPEISAGTASLIAGWINPVVGLGTFLAQWILSRPLIASNTQTFQITGSWTDPKITKLDLRNDNKTEVKP